MYFALKVLVGLYWDQSDFLSASETVFISFKGQKFLTAVTKLDTAVLLLHLLYI